ncbi:nuclease-related domain-containing protein [Ruegeria profundi]|uniref:nuclease-related domain-containing protein n=1 Tax=Ruegeria profundi TaxID=1685378 RepID=UPI001CD7BA3B|nr:NERD domain-containing protein [Ruegeria profundi]MCA0930160.1 NERD domain-containing protein [Ruegeria profundi]
MQASQTELLNLWPLALVLVYWLLTSARFKGWFGEFQVNLVLKRMLDANEYRVLKNVTLPTRSGTTQIDHLVLSRFGVFVIETKNLKGWIFGDADQARWTQVIYGKKWRIQNPLRQNHAHIKAVQSSLNIEEYKIHGIVAFVGSSTFKTAMPANVVSGVRPIVGLIRFRTIEVFSQSEVDELAQLLDSKRLKPGVITHVKHTKHIKKKLAVVENACPRCRSPMVERQNRRTGERFLGCTRYPMCKGTRQLA